MRILLTGGGTGGHILPHHAVIDELTKGTEYLYIGSNSGLEEVFCKEHEIKFKTIVTGKFRRYFSVKNFIDWFKLPIGIVQSLYLVKKFNPDVVFSKGGYVAVPVVIAAGILRKKIVIHESDYTPGLATKISSIFANKICVVTEHTKSFFFWKWKKKIEITGNPIRKEILKGSKKLAEKFLNIKVKPPVLLVMGGSTGALKLNDLIWDSLTNLTKQFTVIHITGKDKGMNGKVKNKKYFEFDYINKELKDIYAITDIIICRSGAGTVSEVNALGLPAIYIPLSSGASRGDQLENATYVSSTPHIILNEKETTSEELLRNINSFYKKNKGKRTPDKHALKAAKNIANIILNI